MVPGSALFFRVKQGQALFSPENYCTLGNFGSGEKNIVTNRCVLSVSKSTQCICWHFIFKSKRK